MAQSEWKGKRVVIIGAARQGIALARYLARHGATIVLNDQRSTQHLSTEMESLSNFKIEWATGGHSPNILEPRPDLLCVSGGIPLDNPLVVLARNKHINISNDTQIFMDAVICKTVGITGSAGKTTTTTLVGRMAQKDGDSLIAGCEPCTPTLANQDRKYGHVWVGGNIGDPLLNYVDEMQLSDLAILEISSFQSELMTKSPNVAALLNITPNHLDRHGTMQNYIAAKAQIINYQLPDDCAILGRDDPATWALAKEIRGHLFSFGFSPLPTGQDGAYIENKSFFFRHGTQITRLPVEDKIELRGEHNRLNTLAACAIAHVIGISPEAMRAGVTGFHGVPHRLEFVCTWHGAQWYNDSIATAPERTIAAIRSFDTPLILLLGGRDKELPWDDLAKLIHQRVDHVIIFGAAAAKIQAAIGQHKPGLRPYSITCVEKCQDAVTAAARLAQTGFVVLFSPGATSYDEFKDFEERGERFRQWVLEFSVMLQ